MLNLHLAGLTEVYFVVQFKYYANSAAWPRSDKGGR